MKNNFKNRFIFLTNFDPSLSLNEQTGPGITSLTPINEPYVKDTKNEYPNYCKYPSMAVWPVRNSVGASGEDALIPNYCYYKAGIANSEKGGVGGVFIPKNSKISFVTSEVLEKTADRLSKQYGENKRDLLIRLQEILPIGTVLSFYNDDGQRYTSRVWAPNDEWVFKWYHKEGDKNTPYVQPEWVDPRTGYGKFIDKWGTLVSFATFIVSAILSPFTEGTSLYIWYELAIELGIGGAIAIRDIQKGDNIGAFFSLVQAFLPLLKNKKILTGISSSELRELQEEIIRAGINENSTQQELIRFYNNLSTTKPELQKTLTKIFDQDPYTLTKLSKSLAGELGEEVKNQIMREMKIMFKENPNLFKDLNLLDKLWARELGLNGIVMIIELASEIALGKKLNNQEKEKLNKIFYKIPKTHHEEFYKSFMVNVENIDEILESEETEKFLFKGEVSTERIVEYQEYLKKIKNQNR